VRPGEPPIVVWLYYYDQTPIAPIWNGGHAAGQ